MQFLPVVRAWVVPVIIVAAAFVIAGVSGLALRAHFSTASVWLPAGIAISGVLIYGMRAIPGILLGALALTLTVSGDVTVALTTAVGSATASYVAWYLLKRGDYFDPRLRRVTDVARLIGYGAFVFATVFGAISAVSTSWIAPHAPVGAGLEGMHAPAAHPPATHEPTASGTMAHGAPSFMRRAIDSWLADVLGILLIAPLVLALRFRRELPFSSAGDDRRRASLILLMLILVTLSIYSGFLEQTFGIRHSTLFVLPPAVWLALQHNVVHTLIGNVAVYFITVIGTALGHGPFSDHTGGLALLMGVFVVTTLLISASRTERKIAEERIHHLATRDSLTNLPNRTLLASELDDALERAGRYGNQAAVLFIDIDYFKRINDSLGHPIGDQVLVMAAERIAGAVHAVSTLARVGGDEFVVIIDHLEDVDLASRVAERITQAMAQPFELPGHTVNLSCSIGISVFPTDSTSSADLIRDADLAMYEAKKSGRNTFRYFSVRMSEQVERRHAMEIALRHALTKGDLFLAYQPIVSVATGQVVSFESLLRWRSGHNAVTMPKDFIFLAEQTSLIEPLGEFVIRSACVQLREWRNAGFAPRPVSINLSVKQLRPTRRTVGRIEAALKEYSVPANWLEVEITESQLLQEDGEIERALRDLDALGIRIAVDDFGTGYSSLTYLRRMPISVIKVDRSFVNQMATRRDDYTLVRAMVQMAHSLGMTVVAEGVEVQAELDLLRELHADRFQGFLFAKPATPSQIQAQFLERA
jgi:diguanylate cyclase (GGDEF)-like protein